MAVADRKPRIAIAGGGLVGALAACFFAKRGHRVAVYEYRPDVREEDTWGQSIDLALSVRGREALRKVGLEETLLQHGIPMRGRMLHNKDGKLKEIIYDGKGNCIYSVSRRYLNVVLLNAAEKYPEVSLYFNKKVIDADLEEAKLTVQDTITKEIEEVQADLIIGADGAHSRIRKVMTRRPRFNYSQTYIEHGYVELHVPPGRNNQFVMSNNHLHIWPRGEFMMIALPNEDRTFTANLFAPFDTLDKLTTSEALLDFCEDQFPDLIKLISKKKLVRDYFAREPKALISVKCKPYHVGKSTLIIGDAAHAMVPFYAQGMNTGFEDVLLLDGLMERYGSDFSQILPKFTELRCEDAHAICDLAMYNYIEMRDLVRTKSFLFRKHLDTFLYRHVPNFWTPMYSTIHFTRMRFRDCIANREWQDTILRRIGWCIVFLILAVLLAPFIQIRTGDSILY
ncbi:kynurenine 3-monooxygenase cn [Megachile rotundata]|uniref:kynurenine 3-monooxygenase cn n=1 Tax=Megachile rotundata TaxID=143995 RepID=UPI000258E3EF|nr:PREDICTED: kynurenine 3-monooxygenase isoform X1 [Megachile rotundata]